MANIEPTRSDGAQARPRKSSLRALLFLVFAAIAAVTTALLITRYMDARTAAVRVPTVQVVVAKVDLPIAATLREDVLAVVDWPIASKPAGAVADPKQIVGQVLNERVVKGEPIIPSKIASGEAGRGLANLLPSGMRAVAVKVDDVVGVAGFIHPGDHVDVIGTMRPVETGNLPFVSKIVLQDLKVLAMGKELDQSARDPSKGVQVTVATLMVDSDEAEQLALVATKGQILLALRGSIDSAVVTTRGAWPAMMFADAVQQARPAEPAKATAARPARIARHTAKAKPEPKPIAQGPSVEIIRGDRFEKRTFEPAERQQ